MLAENSDHHLLAYSQPILISQTMEILESAILLARLFPRQCRCKACWVDKCRCLFLGEDCSLQELGVLDITGCPCRPCQLSPEEHGIPALELVPETSEKRIHFYCRALHWTSHPAGGFNEHQLLVLTSANLVRTWAHHHDRYFYYWDAKDISCEPSFISTRPNALDFILDHSNCYLPHHEDEEDEEWQNILESGGLFS